MLHLYLRSDHAPQSYDNRWRDHSTLHSIQTYARVADHCREAMAAEVPIRIHRRRNGDEPATVCCECEVQSLSPEGEFFRVAFQNWRELNIPIDKTLQRGYYFANPAKYEV